MRGGETVILESDEVIEGDYLAAGERVEVLGTVRGDVYAAGGKVVVEGTVEGDVLAAGGDITINGQVGQDVRAAGGNIDIGGEVGGSVSAAGGNIDIDKEAKVGKSLAAAGGNVVVGGEVANDVRLAAGNTEMGGVVGGRLILAGESIVLNSGARVEGDVEYWAREDIRVAREASVAGQIRRNEVPSELSGEWKRPETGAAVREAGKTVWRGIRVVGMLGFLVVAGLIAMAAPEYTRKMAGVVATSPWKAAGVGLGVLVGVPIAAGLVMLTVIGIPLGILGLVMYGVLIYVAKLPVLVWGGQWILEKIKMTSSPIKALLAGLVIYEVVGSVEIVGGLMRLVVLAVGLGALVLAKVQILGEMRKKKIV